MEPYSKSQYYFTTGGDRSFAVEYLSFDGKYFTPASVKANEDVMSALAKLLG